MAKIDYEKLYKLEAEKLAKISYKKRLKTWLGQSLRDIQGTELFGEIKEAFNDNVDLDTTLDEIRIQTLMRNILKGGVSGMKAIELSYKIDGTLNEVEADVDLEEIEEKTGDIN